MEETVEAKVVEENYHADFYLKNDTKRGVIKMPAWERDAVVDSLLAHKDVFISGEEGSEPDNGYRLFIPFENINAVVMGVYEKQRYADEDE